MFGAEWVAAARCATAGVTSARNSSAVPSRTTARNFTTESVGREGAAQRRRRELLEQPARAVLEEARFQMESGQGFGGEQCGGPHLLDDAAGLEHGVQPQRPGRDHAVSLEVPDHGAVGADDGPGVPELVLQRVEPARRPARDENHFHPGFAAGVEGTDGPVTDFAVMAEDRSVNIACNQTHTASLRGPGGGPRVAPGLRRGAGRRRSRRTFRRLEASGDSTAAALGGRRRQWRS